MTRVEKVKNIMTRARKAMEHYDEGREGESKLDASKF